MNTQIGLQRENVFRPVDRLDAARLGFLDDLAVGAVERDLGDPGDALARTDREQDLVGAERLRHDALRRRVQRQRIAEGVLHGPRKRRRGGRYRGLRRRLRRLRRGGRRRSADRRGPPPQPIATLPQIATSATHTIILERRHITLTCTRGLATNGRRRTRTRPRR